MPDNQIYRLPFVTVSGIPVTVDITDTATVSDDPLDPILLKGSGMPLSLSTINNSQDPFSPILAKNAIIRFLSSASVNADTFSQGTDNRFAVHAYTDDVTIFRGFLLMDDIEERLRNPAFSNEVTLVATDNIGTLKDLELINNTYDAPLVDGHYWILSYLLLALGRTGLQLNLNIAWNVFEQDFDEAISPLRQTYLWTLTFEKEVGTKQDCYTVLTDILSALKSRLFQSNGEWWIIRNHEYRTTDTTLRRITYAFDGSLVNDFEEVEIEKVIGFPGTDPVFLINADAQKLTQRPDKYDKDTFHFDYPKELPRNVDFTHGDIVLVVDPYFPLVTYANTAAFPSVGKSFLFYKATDTGFYYTWNGGKYVYTTATMFLLDYWTMLHSHIGSYVTNDSSVYIKRTYDETGVENSREIVVYPGTEGDQYYVVSEPLSMHQGDKFNISTDFRFGSDINGASGVSYMPVMQIRLTGEDGSKWLWSDGTPAGNNNYETAPHWINVSTPGTFINLDIFIWYYWDVKLTDDSDWQSVSAEVTPLPVNGDIQIALVHARPFVTRYKSFSHLSLDYIPFINGTYQKYSGRYNKVTQDEGFKANHETDVRVSDSPKKLFKGALKKFNGTSYVLTETWTDAFSGLGPAPLGKILVYDEWNQYRKPRKIIPGTVKGISEGTAFCLLSNKWAMTTYSETKRFLCLHYDLDVKKEEARGEWMEVFDTGEENDYESNFENKLTQ